MKKPALFGRLGRVRGEVESELTGGLERSFNFEDQIRICFVALPREVG